LKKRKTFTIALIGGIGNIIQLTPLMAFLKSRQHIVIAERHPEAWSDEICEMVSPVYDELMSWEESPEQAIRLITGAHRHARALMRLGMPEWATYFHVNHINAPPVEKVKTVVDFTPTKSPSRIVLAPCCKKEWPMKRWPHWNDLLSHFKGCTVVGMPDDGGKLDGNFTDLRGMTTLKKLAGILADAEYVIAEEGGIAHLACAVGTRTYILYGGTMVTKNLPPHHGIPILSPEEFECRPCQLEPHCYMVRIPDSKHPMIYGCKREQLVDGYARCMVTLKPYDVLKALKASGEAY
jgi:hypothetical protein